MPLEFALRPRFNLERSAPQRKPRLRIPPLALFMPAYWLAIAGVTELLLRTVADEPTASASRNATMQQAEVDVSPSLPIPTAGLAVAAQRVTLAAPSEPSWEPGTSAPAAPAPAPDREPVLAPSAPARQAAAPRVTETPAPLPRAYGPVAALRTSLEPPPAKRNSETPAARESERPFVREPDRPSAREPDRNDGRIAALPSCESAAASANQSMDLGAAPGAPDLSREAFAAVLENGGYLASCAIPARTALEICAAVQDGKAVGVSVTSEPRDVSVVACVRRAVAALRFPRSARLDVTRTRFAAAR